MATAAVERKKGEKKMRNNLFYSRFIGSLSGLLLLFFVFIPITQAQSQTKDINLNGLWKSSTGAIVEVRQSDGILVGLIKQTGSSSLNPGSINIDGSIKDNTFAGNIYLKALTRSCSFLDGLYPATGTVSTDAKSISFMFEDRKYNAETCDFTGEVDQGTITYTRLPVSPSPAPTAEPIITSQPTVSSQAGGNSYTRIDVPGYTQALVVDPPKVSDLPKIPQSDFRIVYPAGKTPAAQKLSTESANTAGSIFIGKVGDKGEIVVESPNGEKISLTDDRSGYDFLNSRFGATLPGPEMGNPTQLTIREVDCHIIASRNDSGNCDSSGRCRYADIWDAQTRIEKTVGDCTYINEGGPVRVLTEQGQVTFKTPGDVTVVAENADFGIGYSAKSDMSIVEVYNGSVIVTNKAGQAKKISTAYGSQINRIEVNKDGGMTEKIAIPQSQWKAFLASQQEKKQQVNTKSSSPIVPAILVLGMGGLIFFLYKTGKLLLIYKISIQKISELMGKNSKGEERK